MSNPVKLQGHRSIVVFGTVEDIQDPEQLHRVRVRIPMHGSTGQTPKESLPWARTTIPAQGAGTNQGTGGSQAGLSVAEKATCICLVNEDNHEDITVIGVLPVNATGDSAQHTGASVGGQSSVALGGLKDGLTGGKFEPATDMAKTILKSAPAAFPQNKGKYPDTHVNVSKSGFRSIMHDVGNETFKAEVHPTGTFTEMQADGNYVTYTTKDRKEAVDGTYTLGSEGDMVITTNGNLQLKVKGNLLMEVGGRMEQYVAERLVIKSGFNIDVGAKGQVDIIGQAGAGLESPATTFVTGVGAVQINKGSRMGAVPSISYSNPDSNQIRSAITDGSFAKGIK